ncbi:putative lipoate-protein ligase A [Geopyxis carbonaria]|nr:putative lipoate-protein ligase A [Geopyxis carbonaria]
MSPSRGAAINSSFLRTLLSPTHTLATLSASSLRTQIYLSTSLSPHLNLSLEHHLFTSLPPATYTLLLYLNTPSLILGRNQNPWLEVHHPSVRAQSTVQLLRRRSGGGTVYHDLGNVNYSATVPTAVFNRDTHAHLVAGVLGPQARVNERHDIVWGPQGDKVSGSAYKLTRERSYHHGTMLLNCDLESIRGLLRSPLASAVVAARGVASVPSPVTNTGVDTGEFISGVARAFAEMYGGTAGVAVVSEEEMEAVEGIGKGVRELRSQEWVYGQTPRFSVRLPGGAGVVEVEKGVVTTVEGEAVEGVSGCRFGGGVVRRLLQGVGYAEAEKWAAEIVGGEEWGT